MPLLALPLLHFSSFYPYIINTNHLDIVLDQGTGFVKIGRAGENFPDYTFPSIVGRPILRAEERASVATPLKDIMIGDEASEVRSYLQISYPMENGIIKNWTDMELLWDYAFSSK